MYNETALYHQNMEKIPHIIHYCWFGRNPKSELVLNCIESWKKYLPGYEIREWNEDNYDVTQVNFVKEAYENQKWAFVSDYARLKIVYENGGIYLDTDVELLKNLDFLLKYQCYIGVQQVGKFCTTGLGFGAEKNNLIVQMMLKKYDNIVFSRGKEANLACPYLNNEVMQSIGYIYDENNPVEINGTLILPCKYLDPIAPGDNMKNLKCGDTISIHHYSASWMGNKTRLKRRIIRIIGQEKINIIKNLLKMN